MLSSRTDQLPRPWLLAFILAALILVVAVVSSCGGAVTSTTAESAGASITSTSDSTAPSTAATPALGTPYTPPQPEDFSDLSWTQAFEKLHQKFSTEYGFTAWRSVDWESLYDKYQPLIAQAEAAKDAITYYLALGAYSHEMRDGHVILTPADDTGTATVTAAAEQLAGGGFGLVATKLDDGSVIASWVDEAGPAASAGVKPGAQIVEWGGKPVAEALAETSTVLSPSQPTDARAEYERLRLLVRAPVGTDRAVTFKNPGEAETRAATLEAMDDGMKTLKMTDKRSVLNFGWPSSMVERKILDGDVGYVRIHAEIDLPGDVPGDHTPTLQQFQDAIDSFIDGGVAGVIVDIRGNSGGSDQMVADLLGSFYDERTFYEYCNLIVSASGEFVICQVDETAGTYTVSDEGTWIEPQERRYSGPVVALVDNACISSGEGVAMGIKNLPNGRVVGFTGTNGSFGMSGGAVLLPGGIELKWPYGQSLDQTKTVQIDSHNGQGGVLPDVKIPMTLENALRMAVGEDVELEYGLQVLSQMKNE